MRITVERRKRSFAPVAMADIAFLLLIFFIVTVSIGDSPDVKLPPFKYSRETGNPKTVSLTVDASGTVLLDGTEIAVKQLPFILSGMDFQKDGTVNILADEKTPYPAVDAVLQSLAESGYGKVVLLTGEPDVGRAD